MFAIAIEKPLQLADSLGNHSVRIEFKVNQVSFTCEVATALYVYWQLMLSVQCTIWDVDAHILFVFIRELVLEVVHELIYVFTYICVSLAMYVRMSYPSNGVNMCIYRNIGLCILYC